MVEMETVFSQLVVIIHEHSQDVSICASQNSQFHGCMEITLRLWTFLTYALRKVISY